MNYFELIPKKIEELSNIEFVSEKNESLKCEVINSILEGINKEVLNSKLKNEHDKIVNEINENSNIQIITKKKNDQEILSLLDDLIQDHKAQNNLKK